MRAMLPGKSAFFNKLSLDNNYYYLIKDEIVTRYCEIDVKHGIVPTWRSAAPI
ncbi:unnamed protein product [Brugia pahangi]|uniref:Transposase n=1 Tax=Brugia pahangi TaxID=6280 RepID=A0A0N4TG28_BRUPA|nr:unnamed protein product [Brugia pahangi]